MTMLIIRKYFYKPYKPTSSGIMFIIVGLFFLIYVPKLFYTLLILSQKLIFRLYYHNPDLFFKEAPFRLMNLIAWTGSGIVFVIILFGILLGRYRFKIRRISILFENLPAAFDGLKAIQISDLHAGSVPGKHRRFLKIVRMIHNENPDIIFFTGDMVNEFSGEVNGWKDILGHLQAGYGKYSVMGNHDYGDYYNWKSKEEKQENFMNLICKQNEMGFRVLLNESININKNGQQISILGIENWGMPPFSQYGRLDKALAGTDDSGFRILLSHDPTHWDAEVAGKTDIDLTLSGHTHGFQLGIRFEKFRWSPAGWIFKRWEGLHKMGTQYLYINTGLGCIGFPGRIGMPPEITVLTLLKSK
jgi:hypothetical protein